MKARKLPITVVLLASLSLLVGFGLGDLQDKMSSDKDCSKHSDPKKCKKNQAIRDAAKVAVTVAAIKVIHDMIVNYQSTQTSPEDQVVIEYKKKHKTLPPQPEVVEYSSSVKPNEVVKAGKEVTVESNLVVVPGVNTKTVDIQEKIEIFDNEDNSKSIKSLTKPVNDKTKKSGAFKNEFKFTLPEGMPQGEYPIKTLVLVDGKASKPTNNKMQLVLNIDADQNYQIVVLNQ